MSVVRSSKFRHVFGKVMKRDNCYENIRVPRSSLDSMACAVNPKFLAIIVESSGGGAFLVIPLTQYGRVPADQPLVDGHKAAVTDLAFSPHDDHLLASASEDCTAKVWRIPSADTPAPPTTVADLVYHRRRVSLLAWHPTAAGVLLTAGADDRVAVWDVGTGETLLQLDCHPDAVFSACWSWDGGRLVTTCRDKRLRVIDPRSGVVLEEAVCHEGTKPTRAVFLKNGQIFTTGFSKMSEWQYSLREPGRLSEPLCLESNDSTNGIVFPLYDADTNLVYLCGKGDSLIRYYEITGEAPYVHPINFLSTPEPQRGIGMMPKRGCDVRGCEVARFYRLTSSGQCQVISMNCPRKSEMFQSDLYPDTPGTEPALTADEWMSGRDADPVLVSLRFGKLAVQPRPKQRAGGEPPAPTPAARGPLPPLEVTPSRKVIAPPVEVTPSLEVTPPRKPPRKVIAPPVEVTPSLEVTPAQKVIAPPLEVTPSLEVTLPPIEITPARKVIAPPIEVISPDVSDDDDDRDPPGGGRSRSASNLSTLEMDRGAACRPRTRGSSLSEDRLTEPGFEPRARAASSYVRASDLDQEVASHDERLRALEALLGEGGRERLPRVTDLVLKSPTPQSAPPYSSRQYAELKTIPRCCACEEIIFDEEYTWAQEKSYHVKHFTCFKCDKPLAGNEYFLIIERDMPMCFICYQERP